MFRLRNIRIRLTENKIIRNLISNTTKNHYDFVVVQPLLYYNIDTIIMLIITRMNKVVVSKQMKTMINITIMKIELS